MPFEMYDEAQNRLIDEIDSYPTEEMIQAQVPALYRRGWYATMLEIQNLNKDCHPPLDKA